MEPNHLQPSLPLSVNSWLENWRQSYKTNSRLPTAYLLSSFAGLDLKSIAHEMASFLLDSPLENHSDFIEIFPEKSLKIESIRDILARVVLKPISGGHMIIMIHEAEKMTEAAANALLKTLEEPPPYAFFFLTSSSPEKILLTIRSRCQKIAFSGDENTLRNYYQNLITPWVEQLEPLLSTKPLRFTDISAQAEKLSKDVAKEYTDLSPFLQILRTLLRDSWTLQQTNDDQNLIFPHYQDWAYYYGTQKNAFQLMENLDTIADTEKAIEGNVNKQLALERLFEKLFCG